MNAASVPVVRIIGHGYQCSFSRRVQRSGFRDDTQRTGSLQPERAPTLRALPWLQIAKRQAVVNPENTFFSVKRFIGRKMNEVGDESKQASLCCASSCAHASAAHATQFCMRTAWHCVLVSSCSPTVIACVTATLGQLSIAAGLHSVLG